ncbi:MAG: hypothetical protein ACRC92_24945 [Peptostreptococcaceae bacterium]
MTDIKNDCEQLLIHIKKCKTAMELNGYTDAGVAGYFMKLPFKKAVKRHFVKTEMYTEKIREYIKENNIDMELEVFEELNTSSIIYNSGQLSSLAYKQFQHRIKYLDNLRDKITELLDSINTTENK